MYGAIHNYIRFLFVSLRGVAYILFLKDATGNIYVMLYVT